MKKVIIWDKDMTLKDAGGPSGYLFNLKQYLTLHPTPQITFYSDFVPPQETPDSGSYKVKGLKGRLKETAIGKVFAYLGWFYYQQVPLSKKDFCRSWASQPKESVYFMVVGYHTITQKVDESRTQK